MSVELNLQGLKSANDVNALTTVLIMLDGVEDVEVAMHWATVTGRVKRTVLIAAIEKAGFTVTG